MSKIEVDTIAPQSGTTLTVGEAGDTVDISNATLSANLNATNLTSGTIPDARFPATLPAVDGSQLTGIQITGGYTICDSITVTNTDTFALTAGGSAVSPESAANCLVSLNGILQAPISSYTISGSNIVFASALVAGSDVIDFITVLGTALNIGTPSDGTVGLNKLSATGTKDSTTFLRGDNTFAVPAGGTNTPAWRAKLSAAQSYSNATTFKVDFDTEIFDTDGAYDPTTNQRFTVPSGQAGKYFITSTIYFDDTPSTDALRRVFIYKNGSEGLAANGRTVGTTGRGSTVTVVEIAELSVGDYIEIYAYSNSGSGGDLGSGSSIFQGFKLVE